MNIDRLSPKTKVVVSGALLLAAFVVGVPAATIHAEVNCTVAGISYIDTHNHLLPGSSSEAEALHIMANCAIQKTLLMPAPRVAGQSPEGDYQELAKVMSRHPDQFGFLGGGATLNPIIHAVSSDEVSSELRNQFKQTAIDILRFGALGFGEFAAQHFSLSGADHPYESAPPDHQLFLDLADIAAQYDVPIDLHMEAVPCVEVSNGVCGIPLPAGLDPQYNPPFVPENLTAFERLLGHNSRAKIVWAHAGMDRTGYRTVDLMRGLLQNYPNLYLSIKLWDRHENHPLDKYNLIKPEWLALISDFPDRFTMGLDSFYPPRELAQDFQLPLDFLSQLPEDLALKVGLINPACIYDLGLASACIDIKPGSYPNSINLGSRGTVPVAILSSRSFDAMTVNPLTVTLAGAPVKLNGKGRPIASFQDVNGDGLLDLVVHISTEALQLTDTDTIAALEGKTFDGTPIKGMDSVRIVP